MVCLLSYPKSMFPLPYFTLDQVIISLEVELMYLVDRTENFSSIFLYWHTRWAIWTNSPWSSIIVKSDAKQRHENPWHENSEKSSCFSYEIYSEANIPKWGIQRSRSQTLNMNLWSLKKEKNIYIKYVIDIVCK